MVVELDLDQEKIELIKKIITSDKKYTNNEDLFDDFFNETYKRSLLIMKTVKNENSLNAYLRKIVTTSIITVLKDSGRVRRTKEGFVSSEETSLDEIITIPENKFSNVQINYDLVDLSDGPEEIVIKKEVMQTLVDAVAVAHYNNPTKQYMQLYQLRYVKGLKQKEISKELNLSQAEVSKRLLTLMEEIKSAFNKV